MATAGAGRSGAFEVWNFVSNAALAVSVAISLGAVCYLIVAIWCLARLPRAREHDAAGVPATTLLKPLCGAEPGLREALLSFCTQSFPAPLQIIFGARSFADPAVATARELKAQFPDRDIEIVVNATVHGPNLKASNLINMAPFAKHDVLVISDSDARLQPDCLQRVTAGLVDPSVGAVTCLFRGAPARSGGWVAQLGALYIDGWFLPAAIVDASLFGARACYGPLTAIRREILTEAGGFVALTAVLADDTELGHITTRQGRRVQIAPIAVDTTIGESKLDTLFLHELRWARTTRALRPVGYLTSLFTHALPIALLMVALHPTAPTALLFGSMVALRAVLVAVMQAKFGRAETSDMPTPWFLMFREILYFGVWLWAFTGRHILWRGRRLRILPGARIALDAAPANAAAPYGATIAP